MELHQLCDPELMNKVKHGNQEAFVTIVHRHQKSLYNFFYFMGISSIESEDLTQEVFLRLFSCRNRYQSKAKFTTFLYTLARHVWIDHLRKNKKYEKIHFMTMEIVDSKEYHLDLEKQIDIQSALGKLSEKLRPVVIMGVYQNFKYHEIAEILNIPVGTVKSRMYLALCRLKEILSDQRTEQKL